MLIHRCGPNCFLMPTGAPGRGLTAEMTCQLSVVSGAVIETFAGLDGNTDDDGVGTPRGLAHTGCKGCWLERLMVSSISSAAHRDWVDAGRRGVERSGFARLAGLRSCAKPMQARVFAGFAEFARGDGQMRCFIGPPPARRLLWPWDGPRGSASRGPSGCAPQRVLRQHCEWHWDHCDRHR